MARREPGRARPLVTALLFALAIAACEQSGSSAPFCYYDLQTVNIRSHKGVSYINGQPVNGIVFVRNADGDTIRQVPFTNGKENGTAKTYYDNGKLKEQRVFINGKKEGRHFGWYEDGQRQYVFNYRNDQFDGTEEEWYADGKPYQRLSFKDGHEDGAQQYWYPNGKIKSNYVIKNGRRYGLLGTNNCVNVSDSIGI